MGISPHLIFIEYQLNVFYHIHRTGFNRNEKIDKTIEFDADIRSGKIVVDGWVTRT